MADRGTRLVTVLQTLEKIPLRHGSPDCGEEELVLGRQHVNKVLQYLSGQEKVYRDVMLKNSAHLDLMFTTLEHCSDISIKQTVVQILLEIIGKANVGKRASALVSHGATHVLFSVLVAEAAAEEPGSDDLQLLIHQALSKLGPKDRKFGLKARLSQALQATLALLRNHVANPRALPSVLHVLKLYCNNSVNASHLGRSGVVLLLFKVLAVSTKKHPVNCKHALDALAQLAKSKSNSARIVGQGGVTALLGMLCDWHRSDGVKNRHVALRRAILTVLKHCVNLKSGRRAFADSDGLRVLYDTSREATAAARGDADSAAVDGLVLTASLILRRCFPRNKLPVASLRGPVSARLPPSDYYSIDTLAELGRLEENGYESSVDNDDDVSSGDDADAALDRLDAQFCDPELRRRILADIYAELYIDGFSEREPTEPLPPRTLEDLRLMYDHCFPEMHALPQDPTSRQQHVIIPTASCDDTSQRQQHKPGAAAAAGAPGRRGTRCRPRGNGGGGGSSKSSPRLQRKNQSVTSSSSSSSTALNSRSRLSLPNIANSKSCLSSNTELSSSEDVDLVSESSQEFATPTDVDQGDPPSQTGLNYKWSSNTFKLELDLPDRKTLSQNPFTGQKSKGLKKRTRPSSGVEKGKSVKGQSVQVSGLSRRGRSADNTATLNGKPLVEQTDALSITPMMTSRDAEMASQDVHMASPEGTAPSTDVNMTLRDAGHSSKDVSASSKKKREQDFEGVPTVRVDNDPDLDTEDGITWRSPDPDLIRQHARRTRSVARFNKLAYPELHGHRPPSSREPQHVKQPGVQRAKIFADIDRFLNPEGIVDRVVYDLDEILQDEAPFFIQDKSRLVNRDAFRLSRKADVDHLVFNSQFECGNLRKAIQVREYEYDLIVNPDVNTNHHHQWFYFEVSNMEAGTPYRFNIVNCEKLNSQLNFGMKPVLFSVTEALNSGRAHWLRAGTDICYYRNHFSRSPQATGGVTGKSYYTGSFNITFEHERDVCYIAYHYPYSYTMLQAHLSEWAERTDASRVLFRKHVLTTSIAGNDVPLLTITAQPHSDDAEAIEHRPYIFLSGRVHPGESNASWIMKGTIDYLLSDCASAQALRESYVFKIVPMLNPDGVINGCHRCSLTGEDLNRCWLAPCPQLHPTIHHTKGLLQYLAALGRPPLVYCDYHGHSRKKNVFLYGCSPSQSWVPDDTDNPASNGNKEDTGYKLLPRVLHQMAPAFSYRDCNFIVEKSKEATARVVVWRQIGVVRSYTMESSYCGCDQGRYRGYCLSTRELEEMGRRFCDALLRLRRRVGASGATATAPSSAQLSSVLSDPYNSYVDDDVAFLDAEVGCALPSNMRIRGSRSNSDASSRNAASDSDVIEVDVEDDDDEMNGFVA